MNSKVNRWHLVSIGSLCLVTSLAGGQRRPNNDEGGWQRAEEIVETHRPVRARRSLSPDTPETRPAPVSHPTVVRRNDTPEAPPFRVNPALRPASEMRGMWVVRDTLTSPESIRRMVDDAANNGFNTLFVQVRGRGDAYYRSSYEPRAEALKDAPASFDPLAVTLQEAHARGLQVHAWFNTFLAWSGRRTPKSPDHLWNAHPDWFATDKEGHNSPVAGDDVEGAFLQPSNPEVQAHLLKVFSSVVQNYDVDGIHFDYVRYANSRYDYSTATLKRFRNFMAQSLDAEQVREIDRRVAMDRLAWSQAYPQEWEAWRRAQVTALVSKVADTARLCKPQIQVTAAVYADGKEAAKYRGQEWQSWLQQGYLDGVVLMAYSQQTAKVIQQAQDAVGAANGRRVYVGLGAWRLPVKDVTAKIQEVRMVGANGFCLFSYDSLKQMPDYLPSLSRAVMQPSANVRFTTQGRSTAVVASREREEDEDREVRKR